VLGISCVTNLAAGMSESAIDHEEVLEVGRRVSATLLALLTAIVPRIVGENK
jgi:purine-nucleoside phosphorylase